MGGIKGCAAPLFFADVYKTVLEKKNNKHDSPFARPLTHYGEQIQCHIHRLHILIRE